MKCGIVWVLLLASVGFNVFFAAGYYGARRTADELKTYEGRARLFAKPLNLDAKQRVVFEKMLAKAQQVRTESRQARLPHVQTFLAELSKENPDTQALLDYADYDDSRDYRRANVLMMRDFMAVLNPQQRQAFIKAIEHKAESSK